MQKLCYLVAVFFISGCVAVRTYTVDKPRTDTDIEGNRGYLSGTPEEVTEKSKFGDTRKISVLEIEFGSSAAKRSKIASKKAAALESDEDSNIEVVESEEAGLKESSQKEAGEYQTYVVEKNDTLQKISQKFYGTTKKWQKIYDCNGDILKDPDKVYPGMTLKIPSLD
ncbi:MAG: LysM peptidoglycan-binding domain-containing protein [Candidatus Omnitrophica bacterium]|jgi:LysM repeat protein|nr:LysM peptidoglycan-binding domain-containing protein [Candidatus Omnitrophota bacterium]